MSWTPRHTTTDRRALRLTSKLLLALGCLGAAGWLGARAWAQTSDTGAVVGTLDELTVGAVDPASAPATILVEGRTFNVVAGELETPPARAVLPLTSVLGTTAMTLTDVDIVVDETLHQVAFLGTSTDSIDLLGGVETEVLVVADWVAGGSDTPSFAVSTRAPQMTLGDVLGLDPGSGFVADISLDAVAFTVGRSEVDPDNDPESAHLSYADQLTGAARGFLGHVYGGGSLPDVVPALVNLGNSVHVSAAVDLDGFGELPKEVLSYGDGATIVLEGDLGVGLSDTATFDPTAATWSLGAQLPRVGANLPAVFPDFLEFDPSARFTATIAYGEVNAVQETIIDPTNPGGTPGGTPTPERSVTLTVAAEMTTDLFGTTKEYSVELQVGRKTADPASVAVSLDVEAEDLWEHPFGIDFLSINDAGIEGVFTRETPPSGGAPTTKFEGLVTGTVEVAGKEFVAQLHGEFGSGEINASLLLALDDTISIGDLLAAVGVDTGPIPDSLVSPSFGPAGIEVRIGKGGGDGSGSTTTSTTTPTSSTTTTSPTTTTTVPGSTSTTTTTVPGGGTGGITFSVTATGEFGFELPNGQDLAARVMFSIDGARNSDGSRSLVAGIRSAGKLALSTILPPGVDAPFDLVLADEANSSAFGFVFSTRQSQSAVTLNEQPPFVREFYRPMIGLDPLDTRDAEIFLPAGASVLGSFPLPAEIAGIVDTVGLQSRVEATGTLPVFSNQHAVALDLGLKVKSDLLPDFIDEVAGRLRVSVDLGATPAPKLRMALEGNLRLRLPAGLPPAVAEPLSAAGIPVEAFEDVAENYPCANGSQPQNVSGRDAYRCYDLISLSLEAGIEFQGNKVRLTLSTAFETPRPGDIYRPFGLEWLGIDDARILLALETEGTDIGIDLGLQGDIELRNTDLFAAVQIDVELLADAPYVEVKLDGIRAASGAGIAVSDFFELQHDIATIWARANGDPDPPPIDPNDLDIPDIALRNLIFSFSPEGVPALCIPQGLELSGDLYVNPSGNEPVRNPSCDNGTSIIPDEQDRCLNRRLDGCLASGRLKLSNRGLEGLFQITGFDLGPIHWDDLNVDVAITPANQHVIAYGGARLENFFSDSPDTLVGGRFNVKFEPLQMSIFGEVTALEWSALVDVTSGLDLFTDPTPEFKLHVLLATDQSDLIGSPSIQEFANETLKVVLVPLRTVAIVADEALNALEGDILGGLSRLPSRLRDAGIPVPSAIAEFPVELEDFLDEFSKALDFFSGSTFDLVMNGFPSFEIEVCIFWVPIEGCVEEIEVDFPGSPGLCDLLFPANQFPGLRDSDGDCTRGRLIDNLVFPIFEGAIDAIVDVDVDIRQLIRELAVAGDQPMLQLECVEYFLNIGPGDAFTELTFVSKVFGQPLGFQLGFDFLDPVNSVVDLTTGVVEQFLDPGSVSCRGYNEDLFGDPLPSSTPRLTIDVPDQADEGSPITLNGSFGVPLVAPRTVDVRWGDGTNDSVFVPAGLATFALQHTYEDDNPTSTSADVVDVVATDTSPGGRSDSESVTVRNVAPAVTAVTVESGPTTEGVVETFKVTFADPGVDDTHRAHINWGDGTSSDLDVPAGQRQVTATHVYRDDDPTNTAADLYDVTVSISDDDTGFGSSTSSFLVRNVAPTDVQLAVTDRSGDGVLEENEPVELRVAWTDPGLRDEHTVIVDWGTGADEVATLERPRGARELTVEHVFGDNGEFLVDVLVVDDDTGEGTSSLTQVVVNVDPSVELDREPTFAAPGGDSYMTRVHHELVVSAGATDPGSDDLVFTWAWGDGSVDVETDRVNPPSDDPLPSPSIQPRDVVSTQGNVYGQPCLYWLDLDVIDDDGGPDSDRAPVVAVGNSGMWRPHGWWGVEYYQFDREGDTRFVSDDTLLCYMAVAGHMSSVFGELIPLDTPAQAAEIVAPRGEEEPGSRALRLRQLEQALLAAWLNLASGSTGTDPSGMIVDEFAEIIYAAEVTRLDPTSSVNALFDAWQAVNQAVLDYSPSAG